MCASALRLACEWSTIDEPTRKKHSCRSHARIIFILIYFMKLSERFICVFLCLFVYELCQRRNEIAQNQKKKKKTKLLNIETMNLLLCIIASAKFSTVTTYIEFLILSGCGQMNFPFFSFPFPPFVIALYRHFQQRYASNPMRFQFYFNFWIKQRRTCA